jgi:hypothetical protein
MLAVGGDLGFRKIVSDGGVFFSKLDGQGQADIAEANDGNRSLPA